MLLPPEIIKLPAPVMLMLPALLAVLVKAPLKVMRAAVLLTLRVAPEISPLPLKLRFLLPPKTTELPVTVKLLLMVTPPVTFDWTVPPFKIKLVVETGPEPTCELEPKIKVPLTTVVSPV